MPTKCIAQEGITEAERREEGRETAVRGGNLGGMRSMMGAIALSRRRSAEGCRRAGGIGVGQPKEGMQE